MEGRWENFAISTHKAKPLFGGDVRVAMKRDGEIQNVQRQQNLSEIETWFSLTIPKN